MIASESRMLGIASSTSTNRPTTSSIHPRTNPASRPSSDPATSPTATAMTVAPSEADAPWTTRAYTSRPRWSVPNRCAPDGGCSRSAGTPASGSYDVKSCGTTAHAVTSRTTSMATTSPGRRTAYRAPRRHRPAVPRVRTRPCRRIARASSRSSTSISAGVRPPGASAGGASGASAPDGGASGATARSATRASSRSTMRTPGLMLMRPPPSVVRRSGGRAGGRAGRPRASRPRTRAPRGRRPPAPRGCPARPPT